MSILINGTLSLEKHFILSLRSLMPVVQSKVHLREEFGDSAFKSRQDILAGESRVFAEQSALDGFAEGGQLVDELVDHVMWNSSE